MNQVYIIIGLVVIFSFILVQGFALNKLDDSQPPFTLLQDNLNILTPEDKQSLQMGYLNITPPTTALPPNVACSKDKLVIDLLLDTSGSMRRQGKNTSLSRMESLKIAVNAFLDKLSPDIPIGVQKFGKDTVELKPIGIYKDTAREDFKQTINSLNGDNGTPMRKGFEVARDSLFTALSNPNYSGYTFVLVFLGDGGPSGGINGSQNPLEVVREIKDKNIRIISIGLELDVRNENATPEEARSLMMAIASSSEDFHEPSANELETVYNDLAANICHIN
ncbi:VWA domain-containing protein [Candidatus Daviesbacteria bacterium]|nr:VWA domain-containing protein [Candidatus Daviesbacteria bacterium]